MNKRGYTHVKERLPTIQGMIADIELVKALYKHTLVVNIGKTDRSHDLSMVFLFSQGNNRIKQCLRHLVIVNESKACKADGVLIPFTVVCVVDKSGDSANKLTVLIG